MSWVGFVAYTGIFFKDKELLMMSDWSQYAGHKKGPNFPFFLLLSGSAQLDIFGFHFFFLFAQLCHSRSMSLGKAVKFTVFLLKSDFMLTCSLIFLARIGRLFIF